MKLQMTRQWNRYQKLQTSIKMDNITSFLQILAENSLYNRVLVHGAKNYSIKGMKLQNISPKQVYQHLQKLQQRNKENKLKGQNDFSASHPDTWNNNEFKIFAWISVCYAYLKKKRFFSIRKTKFIQEDLEFQFLRLFFPQKSCEFLTYNLRILSKQASIRRSRWSQEQIELFQSIIKEQTGDYKWTQISFQLFAKSNGQYFQVPQQCREQWINHLNPIVKKDRWTLAEDTLFLQSVLREGKRWSSISKMFDGCRTEHMVKNRYKSIIYKNQSKNKKISEKKLCENILYYLKNAPKQMQSNNNQKIPQTNQNQKEAIAQQNCLEFVNFLEFNNLIKLQTEAEISVEALKQCEKSINLEQVSVNEQQILNELKTQSNIFVELMEVQEQNIYKTHQDLFIKSLLQ